MKVRLRVLWACAMLCFSVMALGTLTEGWTDYGQVDLRNDFGGRLVRGQVHVSSQAEGGAGIVQVDGHVVSDPSHWKSGSVSDGWHEATLQAEGKIHSFALAVLNDPNTVIHEGEMGTDETWSAQRLHVVRHWVRIPKGKTLIIEPDAVVKFCQNTGLCVDGVLIARRVLFVPVSQDKVGGDTDMNGDSVVTPEETFEITGSGVKKVHGFLRGLAETEFGTVDVRDDLGGRMAVGNTFISPKAEVYDQEAQLTIDGRRALGWSPSSPLWRSSSACDGWRRVKLVEGGSSIQKELAVLNSPGLLVHQGLMSHDETWTSENVHVIRHWVRVPEGKVLTIAPNSTVKFCQGTGIRVDGTLQAEGVVFTPVSDDDSGGDTDMNGSVGDVGYGTFQIDGSGQINYERCVIRFHEPCPVALDLVSGWNLVSVPSLITDVINLPLIAQWKPFVVGTSGYERAQLPLKPGTVLWIYSGESKRITLVGSEKLMRPHPELSGNPLRFMGVPGGDDLRVPRELMRGAWEWRSGRFVLVEPSSQGAILLKSGKGYIVY